MGFTHSSPEYEPPYQYLQYIIPQESEILTELQTQLCLEIGQIYQIYSYFCKLDRKFKGYLELDDFIEHFSHNGQENFVQLPYLEYLFTLIKKDKPNIVFFEEFIRSITIFCLMNNQSILEFVFDCIDKDDDGKVNKEDIKRFLVYKNPKNAKDVFFINFFREIDRLKLKQNQTVFDFQQFRSNTDRLYFLIWPAHKLQDRFRKQILGVSIWFDLYSKAQKRQYEIKNNQKKQSRSKQKLQILKNLRRKQQGPFFKNELKNRRANQVNTDLKVQRHMKRQRKNSCPYIKPQFKTRKEDPDFN